ncbi:protein YhfH [Bacillus sonorensis]|nr:protein YhfH [Bacillus sonorensis]MCY8606761.1 YhfH family protein [Bacillus sonorensis]
MSGKITDYIRHPPATKGAGCGREMEEQHECYGNTCCKCLKLNDL